MTRHHPLHGFRPVQRLRRPGKMSSSHTYARRLPDAPLQPNSDAGPGGTFRIYGQFVGDALKWLEMSR